MRHQLRVAWTIARRDYAAAVFSRLFLLFLVLPFLAAGLGGLFGAIHTGGSAPEAPPLPIVAVAPGAMPPLAAARERLAALLGDDALPRFSTRAAGAAARLAGPIDRPHLALAADAPDAVAGQTALIVAEARAPSHARPLPTTRAAPPRGERAGSAIDLARGTQYVMFILTIMLAGRLLANFIEERGNKVIEVLAAAVPADAIFIGKLAGMLLFSFTCIAAWGGAALVLVAVAAPGMLATIVPPAVGWAVFVPLALLYFAADYLLFGTILLGLGAHARSPADVQTLALPTTIAQFLLFGLAAADVGRPESGIAIAAAVLPWSSPLALVARAAERPALWPHVLGLGWAALWLWLSIRVASRRFRRAVLGSSR